MHHEHTHTPHEEQGCCAHHDHAHVHDHASTKKGTGKHHNALLWTTIVAACSHIFCCVLPGVFALLALLSNAGIVAALPGWAEELHDVMHGTEVPVLIFSGVVVLLGWLAHMYSKGHDCHAVGECHHESCQPRKKKVSVILIIASLLFAVNLVVYLGFHQEPVNEHSTELHLHDDHDH